MKLYEIVSIANGISILNGKHLPAKINYALMKNKKAILEELKNIQEQRIEIMKSHSKKDENGEPVTENDNFIFENDEEREKAVKEYAEFLNVDADINIIKVTFDDIEKCDDLEPLTMAEIEVMEFMID